MIENLPEVEIVNVLKAMSDDELHASAVKTAERERKITLALLRHLNEIERRHLFSKFSVSSLHAYCVKELKFDEGGAGRRVSAARLLKEIPVIEEKILSGEVTLTSVAQAGIFFRKEARNGNRFSTTQKQNVLKELENKSTREVDRILISKSDQPEIHLQEKIIARATTTEVHLHLDDETMEALQKLKELWSHAQPNANLADTIKRAAKEALKKQTSAPKSVKRKVWQRDEGQCTFTDPNGTRCESKHFLEEDHIQPKAAGGEYTVENIRLRCRAHNQRHAIDFYGLEKMAPHLRH